MSAVGTALWRLDASGFHKERQSANDHLTQTFRAFYLILRALTDIMKLDVYTKE